MKTKLFFTIVILLTVVGCNNQNSAVKESNVDFYEYEFDRTNPDVEEIKNDAESGNAKAQFTLGAMYMTGHGVPQDKTEGIKWVKMSAENNFAYAQAALGACYADGNGVSRDNEEALKWLRKAVDNGYSEAQEIIDDIKK